MKLYKEWDEITKKEMNPEESKSFWEAYFLKEKTIYEDILENKKFVFDTTLKDFAENYQLEIKFAVGFFDGINTSLKTEINLEGLEEDSKISAEIEVEKLYYNMHVAGAEWLYELPQWDDILSLERRKEIEKEYRSSKTVVNENKLGRNDVCSCGSGKKYKKCCGK